MVRVCTQDGHAADAIASLVICAATCEALGHHIGPANGIEKMERERRAADESATWYKPFLASLGKYMGSKGPGFLEMS